MTDDLIPGRAVVIGASAGALEALTAILPALPAGFSMPVFVVVHIPPDKKNMLPELFEKRCALSICEIDDKQPIKPATLYFAPPDYHVLIEKNGLISLSNEEPVLFSRPSIDVMFESAADVYGEGLIGVILTGANEDGAKGLRAITDAGGTALVQSPASATSSAMPEAALAACPQALSLTLPQIADYLKKAGTI